MEKNKILEKIRLREEHKYNAFYQFVLEEGFTETIDKIGNFSKNKPLFYKKIAQNKFFAFNIPYYGKILNVPFQTNFWLIKAFEINEILENRIQHMNLETIVLGFNLELDLEEFRLREKAEMAY